MTVSTDQKKCMPSGSHAVFVAFAGSGKARKGIQKVEERTESGSGLLVRECVELLRERFPAAFGTNVAPLKVGIGNDAHTELRGVFGRKIIEAAIGRHVRTRAYLLALMSGSPRVNLRGDAVARVSEAEAGRAKRQLQLMDTRGGQGSDGLAKKGRAQLLRRFEASTKPLQEFADLVELDAADAAQRLDLARHEREQRQAEAKELVERWRKSGLSRNQFCKTSRIKPRKLETALERMGVVLEDIQESDQAH